SLLGGIDHGWSNYPKHDLRQPPATELDLSGLLQGRGRAVCEDHADGQVANDGPCGIQQHLQSDERRVGDAELRGELVAAGDGSARSQRALRSPDALLGRVQLRRLTRRSR